MADKIYKGTIKKWNKDKGFGFIQGEQKNDIFIHISALEKHDRFLQVGDTIWYELGSGKNGKVQAINASTQAKPKPSKPSSHQAKPKPSKHTSATHSKRHKQKHKKKNVFSNLIFSIIILLGVAIIINKSDVFTNTTYYQANGTVRSSSGEPSEHYRCEGKTYCSQMRSCSEAKFYINNCPNTKMDGDRDGVPCESQWCTH